MRRITQTKKRYTDNTRFGILNSIGHIWTSDTFLTEAAALAHITAFWARMPGKTDLSCFTVIPVKVVVSPLTPADVGATSTRHGESSRNERLNPNPAPAQRGTARHLKQGEG
jgi:hypothetical protein